MARRCLRSFSSFQRVSSNITRPHDEIIITFLGTGSQMPTKIRGTSCISLQKSSDVWLFDCGESSQKQLQMSNLKPSNIKKIFLTHLHGDHSFGLAGVLCMIGQSRDEESSSSQQVIDIYGPEGTRAYIRAITQLTHSYVSAHHRIHELKSPKGKSSGGGRLTSFVEPVPLQRNRYGERPGSTDIYPQPDGSYRLVDEGTDDHNFLKVIAAPIRHTVPCVGYVVEDLEFRDRNLKVSSSLRELVERNAEALEKIYRVKERVYNVIKLLAPGQVFSFPDGTAVRAEDVLHEAIPSRKLVIMGDTSDGSDIAPFATQADLLIHEATLAYFPEEEQVSYAQFERLTRERGHSTPDMAGKFAAQIGAKQLILTHFSGRYSSSESPELKAIMQRIVKIAEKAGQPILSPNSVTAAHDFLSVKVPISRTRAQLQQEQPEEQQQENQGEEEPRWNRAEGEKTPEQR